MQKTLDPTRTGREAGQLDHNLHKRIVGQAEAIEQVVNIYQTYLAGMNGPGRPVGNFLFLGPTGSGKTRMVEATAESLLGDARAVIKIDCAEFQHSHEIAKLIGSPPGYLGHRETHPLLSQEVLNQFHTEKVKLSFVLFDEIEKASDALWNLLLGILDKATLTLGDNRRVDFSRSMIFMTSNLGAAEMSALLNPNMGFSRSFAAPSEVLGDKLNSKIASAGLGAARKKFTPEFMNRLDKVVVFRSLGEAELRRILDLELAMVQRRLFTNSHGTPFLFKLTSSAKDFLLREGTDMKYGARHLKRSIERSLVYPMSNLIVTEQVRGGDLIRVDYDPELSRMNFVREAEGMPAYSMVEAAGVEVAALSNADAAGALMEQPRSTGARSTRK
ncbi:MAG: ATP-dependent Clp protease ATP-binding subunit [Acidobacteria bacterium]|nr:ATP-dependent Clp protease ATP-binding subunit [Acidobacteriota bacterium]